MIRSVEQAYHKAAQLILQGRYGRACRVVARVVHTSPVLLKDIEARKAWARKRLGIVDE